MSAVPIRAVLTATGLGPASRNVIRTAAAVAGRSGASLHVIHALDRAASPFQDSSSAEARRLRAAEIRLGREIERALGKDAGVDSQVVREEAASAAILTRAAEVGADLLVIGAHRGAALEAKILGTTADRLIRAAEIPCLIVRREMPLPARLIGVPIDFSDPAGGALDLALAWASVFTTPPDESGDASVRVLYVARGGEDDEERVLQGIEDEISASARRIGLEKPPAVEAEVREGERPASTTTAWVEERGVDLLALATHGRTGLKRALIGSTAAALAREAPCTVLLVPPSLRRGLRHEEAAQPIARLDRLVMATDFSPGSEVAAAWARLHFAPEAEHVLVHSLGSARLPAFLNFWKTEQQRRLEAARMEAEKKLEKMREQLPGGPTRTRIEVGDPAECIVGVAAEENADLIVLGEHGSGRRPWGRLDTTAERVLHISHAPVLVARAMPPGPPRKILVALEDSPTAGVVLAWARLLLERWDARATVFHAVNVFGYQYAPPGSESEREGMRHATAWLNAQIRAAGIPGDRAEPRVCIGDPEFEILSSAARLGTDLIVMGTRRAGTVGRALAGSVAASVLEAAPCPVLVIGRR